MSAFSNELDITKNIKIIEQLKCQLLANVSELFAAMSDSQGDTRDSADVLADIVIISYLLSEKLGTQNTAFDIKIISKIKLGLLDESTWRQELKNMLKHFDTR